MLYKTETVGQYEIKNLVIRAQRKPLLGREKDVLTGQRYPNQGPRAKAGP